MKKGKIVALLSLSVLTLGVVAGGIASEGGFFSELDAQGGEPVASACSLTFGKLNKPTFNGTNGIAKAKHTSMAYKNAEAAKGAHVKLNADGEMYTTGAAYNNELQEGYALNGLQTVNVEFTATGSELHLLTSVDGTSWCDHGALTSNSLYVIPSTQVAPKLIRLVAKNGSVIITKANFGCTGDDLVKEATATEHRPTTGYNFKGTLSVTDTINTIIDSIEPDEPGGEWIETQVPSTVTYKDIQILIEEKTVTVPVYNPHEKVEANRISYKTLYRAGAGYYDEDIMTFEGELLVENLNGKNRGMTVLAVENNGPQLNLFYNSSLNDGKMEYSYSLRNASKFAINKELTIKQGDAAVADGAVINTTKNEELVFTAKNTTGTDEKVEWTADSNLVDITPSYDKKTATIKFVGNSGDAVITVKCGKISRSFTLHVEDSSTTVDFPAELKNTSYRALIDFDNYLDVTLGDTISVVETYNGQEGGTIDSTLEAAKCTEAADGTIIINCDDLIIFSYKNNTLSVLDASTGGYLYGTFDNFVLSQIFEAPKALKNKTYIFKDVQDIEFTVIFNDYVSSLKAQCAVAQIDESLEIFSVTKLNNDYLLTCKPGNATITALVLKYTQDGKIYMHSEEDDSGMLDFTNNPLGVDPSEVTPDPDPQPVVIPFPEELKNKSFESEYFGIEFDAVGHVIIKKDLYSSGLEQATWDNVATITKDETTDVYTIKFLASNDETIILELTWDGSILTCVNGNDTYVDEVLTEVIKITLNDIYGSYSFYDDNMGSTLTIKIGDTSSVLEDFSSDPISENLIIDSFDGETLKAHDSSEAGYGFDATYDSTSGKMTITAINFGTWISGTYLNLTSN